MEGSITVVLAIAVPYLWILNLTVTLTRSGKSQRKRKLPSAKVPSQASNLTVQPARYVRPFKCSKIPNTFLNFSQIKCWLSGLEVTKCLSE